MDAKQFAKKIADFLDEMDADSVGNVPVNVGDEDVVRTELERRGFAVSVVPTYFDAERARIARYVFTVTRQAK